MHEENASTSRKSGGEQPDPREPTRFADFAEEWLSQCALGAGLTESQLESDASILRNHLLPFFGVASLDAITPREVDRFKAFKRTQQHQYGQGYAAKSINNHLSVLHRIFEKAIEYELTDKNPVTPRAWLKRDRTAEDARAWWTQDEEHAAVATLEQWKATRPARRIVLLIQLVTGLRFSEIRALEHKDVDLHIPGLWIRRAMARKRAGTPKNKKARFQVIPRVLADELDAWMKQQPAIEGLLFRGPQGGPLANNSLNRWYRQLASEAGVRPISSHGARHTTGSSYAVMGVGQKMIAKLLGHADTGATERYTHIQVDSTKPLVEARWKNLMR